MADKKTPKTDICLLLEGTYPYVMGGVAQWVHHLTGALQEYTFSLAVILADDYFTLSPVCQGFGDSF